MNNDNKLILEPDNDISTSDQTNNCEEITLLKDDIEIGQKPFDINEDPCIKNLNIAQRKIPECAINAISLHVSCKIISSVTNDSKKIVGIL